MLKIEYRALYVLGKTLLLSYIPSSWFWEIGSYYVARAGIRPKTLLSTSPHCWDYRCVNPYLVDTASFKWNRNQHEEKAKLGLNWYNVYNIWNYTKVRLQSLSFQDYSVEKSCLLLLFVSEMLCLGCSFRALGSFSLEFLIRGHLGNDLVLTIIPLSLPCLLLPRFTVLSTLLRNANPSPQSPAGNPK